MHELLREIYLNNQLKNDYLIKSITFVIMKKQQAIDTLISLPVEEKVKAIEEVLLTVDVIHLKQFAKFKVALAVKKTESKANKTTYTDLDEE